MGSMNPHECPATVKDCIRCKKQQPISEFYKKKKRADGSIQYMAECKACYKIRSAELYQKRKPDVQAKSVEYRKANKDRIAQYMRDYYQANRDEVIAKTKAYQRQPHRKEADKQRLKSAYESRRDEILARNNAYNARPEIRASIKERSRQAYARNPTYFVAKGGERRARRVRATPKWCSLPECRNFYVFAKWMTDATGERHVVDHIIPLKGRGVSGLHVPWNLQVVTQAENLRKSNRHS